MPRPKTQILICCNERGADAAKASCAPRGAVELLGAIKDEIRSRGLRDEILATRTGCLKHCSRGTTVAVWPHNHWYGGVEPQDAADLVEAASSGILLGRRAMPEGPWE